MTLDFSRKCTIFEVLYYDEGGDSLLERGNPIFTYSVVDATSIVDYSKKEHFN